ncbi:condensation domain-containing protein [Microbacterium foliorum]|uniref:condensation domain-containing protein n=1 Tax=Microbacterium foliorum TaxID=104336 RepID=UPI0028D17C6E|nr:condensation domain-containing protein [Microbacterium foliorum]
MSAWFETLPGQQAIIRSQQLDPRVEYMMRVHVEISSVSPERFAQACENTLRKFECLRVRFRINAGDDPRQRVDVVRLRPGWNIDFLDIDGETRDIMRLLRVLDAGGFDLETDSFVKFRFIRRSADSNLATLAVHHAVADGISLERIAQFFRRQLIEPLPPGGARALADDVKASLRAVSKASTDHFWEALYQQLCRSETVPEHPRTGQDLREIRVSEWRWANLVSALSVDHITAQGWLLRLFKEALAPAGRGGLVNCQFQLRSRSLAHADGMFAVGRPVALDGSMTKNVDATSIQSALLRVRQHVLRSREMEAKFSEPQVVSKLRTEGGFNFVSRSTFGSPRQKPDGHRSDDERVGSVVWDRPIEPDYAVARLTVTQDREAMHLAASFHPGAFPPERADEFLDGVHHRIRALTGGSGGG